MAECNRCKFQEFVTGLACLVKKQRTVAGGKTVQLSLPGYVAVSAKHRKVRQAASELASALNSFLPSVEDVILPLARKVCLECSCVSDDDNPSRHGQVFVSLDAMSPASADPEGEVRTEKNNQEDDEQTQDDAFFRDDEEDSSPLGEGQGNWLNRNAIKSPSKSSASGVTPLPAHIEDVLRKILHQFAALDIYEQNLVMQQMGGQSFADFGTMAWVPDDMKHPQSKQLVSNRWEGIVKKFPIAAALRRAQPLKGANTDRNRRYSSERFQQLELCIPFGFPGADSNRRDGLKKILL